MRLCPVLFLCLCLCACRDPSPPAPAPEAPPAQVGEPAAKGPLEDAPAPTEAAAPAAPAGTHTARQICTQELAPLWGVDQAQLHQKLAHLARICGDRSFCQGEGGFVVVIEAANKDKSGAAACAGCHQRWRARWGRDFAQERFAW